MRYIRKYESAQTPQPQPESEWPKEYRPDIDLDLQFGSNYDIRDLRNSIITVKEPREWDKPFEYRGSTYFIAPAFSKEMDEPKKHYREDSMVRYYGYRAGWMLYKDGEPIFLMCIYEPYGWSVFNNMFYCYGHENVNLFDLNTQEYKGVRTR